MVEDNIMGGSTLASVSVLAIAASVATIAVIRLFTSREPPAGAREDPEAALRNASS